MRNRPTLRREEWPTIVSLATLVVAFTAVIGPLGIPAGLGMVAVWYGLGTPYAIAVGHVFLVIATPGGIDPVSVIVFELAVVTLVVTSALSGREDAGLEGHGSVSAPDWQGIPGWLQAGFIALSSTLVLGGIGWAVSQGQPLWLAAVLTMGSLVVLLYGLHRYELVSLGLVTADERTADESIRQPPDAPQTEPDHS